MKPSKDELGRIFGKKENLIKFAVVILVFGVIASTLVFTGLIKTPLTDPLKSFEAPSYIPDGYVCSNNNSTSNEQAYTFTDKSGHMFIVAAVKNMNNSELSELTEPLNDSSIDGMNVTNENIIVEDHPVVFQTIGMEFMGANFNIIRVTWFCNETGLTIMTTGTIEKNETEEMKKMIQSIQCHPTKKSWNIF